MKGFLACALVYCAYFTSISADITSHLNSYQSIDCTFEERGAAHKKHAHASGRTHPHMPIEHGTSLNWSGYASATNIENPTPGTVSAVKGTWTVPQLSPTAENGYTAIWVGIDGYGSPTVEQLGTEHDWVNGVQQNSAWFEMYPHPSYGINGFPVDVGDVIEAEVIYLGHNAFQLSMVNHSKGTYTVIPGNLTKSTVAKRSSAEWIVEAPYSSEILPLSDFREVAFVNCTTTINGTAGGISHQGCQADALNMQSGNGTVKAVTSNLAADSQSFTVIWEHQ